MTIDTDTYRKNLLKYTGIAYALLPSMDKPLILDSGCGTGVPTIYLAQISRGSVVGVDIDGAALKKMENKVRRLKLSRQITIINSPIEKISYFRNRFDIGWAEGSISKIGFPGALKVLGRYVREGGFLIIHDDAGDYMNKINTIEQGSFKLHGFFLLGSDVWWDEYYRHIEKKLKNLSPSRLTPKMKSLSREIEQFKQNREKFVSAFFLMKKN